MALTKLSGVHYKLYILVTLCFLGPRSNLRLCHSIGIVPFICGGATASLCDRLRLRRKSDTALMSVC